MTLEELWHRLLGRPVSESGRLCHGDGSHEGGERCRRGLVLPILIREALVKAQPTWRRCRPSGRWCRCEQRKRQAEVRRAASSYTVPAQNARRG